MITLKELVTVQSNIGGTFVNNGIGASKIRYSITN
jgi:hypothetical protein